MSTSDAYWDSGVAYRDKTCPCALHGGGPEKYQPVFYINGEAVNLDITFDTREKCDQFIADELEPPVPGWLEENPKIDATDEDLLDRIRELVSPEPDDIPLIQKHLDWHDLHQGFVHDHIHYDMATPTPGGVVR